MINGVTQLIMTKTDVLNGFEVIEAAIGYMIDGELNHRLPYDLCMNNFEPVYEEFNGWGDRLNDVKLPEDLPETLVTYLEELEDFLGIPFTMISTGPERHKIIHRPLEQHA